MNLYFSEACSPYLSSLRTSYLLSTPKLIKVTFRTYKQFKCTKITLLQNTDDTCCTYTQVYLKTIGQYKNIMSIFEQYKSTSILPISIGNPHSKENSACHVLSCGFQRFVNYLQVLWCPHGTTITIITVCYHSITTVEKIII